jgi:homoserine O-acetyltransferase
MDAAIKQVKNGSVYLIPGSPETRGHGTVGSAKLWKQVLPDLLGEPALAGK